jgi:hypothetical protein
VVSDVVLEERRADAHGQPFLGGPILYGDRYAGERARITRRDSFGFGERPVGVHETEGVDAGFALFEPTKSGLDELARAHLSGAHQSRQFQCRSHEQLAGRSGKIRRVRH